METCKRCGLPHATGGPCPIPTSLRTTWDSGPLPVGTTIAGRYRIDAVLHCSGMSTVYQASDLRSNGNPVALKEYNATGLPLEQREEALKWLAREAGLLSVLNYAQLPQLLGSAVEGDRHFVAMPWIEGETLEERVLREGPQAEGEVLRWSKQLCSLLEYLHHQDPPVIHRDLKPTNVKLRVDGSIALLDLGVSRPLMRGFPGTAVGTPGYAPPEQYQGLADERSDLYALGATMHRALTGYDPEHEAPFRHPAVRDLNPAVSPATANLVAHLLQIAPDMRPASAARVNPMLCRAEQDLERQHVDLSPAVVGEWLAGVLRDRRVAWATRLGVPSLVCLLLGLALAALDRPSDGSPAAIQWPIQSGPAPSTAFRYVAQPTSTPPPVTQPFTNIRALAADARGDLFILDEYGVHKRLADGTFYTMAAFAGSGQTCTQAALGDGSEPLLMTANATGDLYLVRQDTRLVYEVFGTGRLRLVMRLPVTPDLVAAGPNHELFFIKDASGTIYRADLVTTRVTVAARIAMAYGLAPTGLAIDRSGAIYEGSDGALWVKAPGQGARPLTSNWPATDGMNITTGSTGDIYASVGGGLYRIDPRGNVTLFPSSRSAFNGAILTAIGSTLYLATDPTNVYPNEGYFMSGGTDDATLSIVPVARPLPLSCTL
jgi:serine/threonine protein kinase